MSSIQQQQQQQQPAAYQMVNSSLMNSSMLYQAPNGFVAVKVTVNDITKRVNVDKFVLGSRGAVVTVLQQAFQTSQLSTKTMKYEDDEGDLITIETDSEWQDFINCPKKKLKLEDVSTSEQEKKARKIAKQIHEFNTLLEAEDEDSLIALQIIANAVRAGAKKVGDGAWEKIINKQVEVSKKPSDSKVLEIDVKNASVELKPAEQPKPAQPIDVQPPKPLEDTWTYVEVQNQLPGISKLQPQPVPQQPAPVVQQQPQPLPQFNGPFQPQIQQPYGVPVYSPFMAQQQQQSGNFNSSPSPVPFGQRPVQPQQPFPQQPQQPYPVQPMPQQPQQPQHFYYPQQQQQPAQVQKNPQQPQQPQQFAPMFQQPQYQQPQQAQHSPQVAKALNQLKDMGVTLNPHVEELAKKHNGDISKIFHEMYTK